MSQSVYVDAMSDAGFRPTYTRRVELSADSAAARVGELLSNSSAPLEGQHVGRHVILSPASKHRKWYSAHLTLEFESNSESESETPESDTNASTLRARFHPKPSLWTLVMAIELGCLTGVMIAGMWGASELMLGKAPWALAVAAPLLLLGIVLLIGARVAQRIDRPNMLRMRDAVDEALGTAGQATNP